MSRSPRTVGGLALCLALAAGAHASEPRAEYEVKAAFVYKIARFVEWPGAPGACPDAVTVAILGRDPFGDAIDRAVGGRQIDGRPLRVLRLASLEALPGCSVLWVGADHADQLDAILPQLRNRLVALAGDAKEFARRGGAIALVVENDRVQIELNPEAAAAAGITISSRLLGVARLVGPAPRQWGSR